MRKIDLLVATGIMDRDSAWQFHPFTDPAAAWSVVEKVCGLARYNGEIVQHHETIQGIHYTRGVCLDESYICHLLRVTNPHLGDFEITTMSSNNWIRRHFRSDELLALARATPLQQCLAALRAVGCPESTIAEAMRGEE